MNDALLSAALGAAVPLWVDQIIREDWSDERRQREAGECSTVVASNALAKGVALLSFSPGGVVCFGTRYSVVEGVLKVTAP